MSEVERKIGINGKPYAEGMDKPAVFKNPEMAKKYPNLRPLTSERARETIKKSHVTLAQRREERKKIMESVKAFMKMSKKGEHLDGMDVLQGCIHMAIDAGDYEAAARYASQIAEYQKPKLARVEKKVHVDMHDMTDEELQKIIASEDLLS
jgi:hypothetical protein